MATTYVSESVASVLFSKGKPFTVLLLCQTGKHNKFYEVASPDGSIVNIRYGRIDRSGGYNGDKTLSADINALGNIPEKLWPSGSKEPYVYIPGTHKHWIAYVDHLETQKAKERAKNPIRLTDRVTTIDFQLNPSSGNGPQWVGLDPDGKLVLALSFPGVVQLEKNRRDSYGLEFTPYARDCFELMGSLP